MNNTTNTNTNTVADVFEAYTKLKDCIASLNEIKAHVREFVHIDCEMEQAFGTLMSFASTNGVTTGVLMEDLAKAKILHKIVDEIDDVVWFNIPADRDEREARLEEQKDEIVAAISVAKAIGEDDDAEDLCDGCANCEKLKAQKARKEWEEKILDLLMNGGNIPPLV